MSVHSNQESGKKVVRLAAQFLGDVAETQQFDPAAAILQGGNHLQEIAIPRYQQYQVEFLRLDHGVDRHVQVRVGVERGKRRDVRVRQVAHVDREGFHGRGSGGQLRLAPALVGICIVRAERRRLDGCAHIRVLQCY